MNDWPIHPAANLFPMLNDETRGYRTCTPTGLTLCELHPSAKHPGYWFITTFDWPAGDVEGTKRPVRADAVAQYVEMVGVDPTGTWTPFPSPPVVEPPWFGTASAHEDDRSVYLIQSIDGGPVKIGSAFSAAARMGEIQRMSPVPLRVVATIPGGYATETALHRRFATDRLHGEWFTPSESLFAAFGVTR